MVEPLAHALFRSLREAGFFLHEIHHVVRLKTQFIQQDVFSLVIIACLHRPHYHQPCLDHEAFRLLPGQTVPFHEHEGNFFHFFSFLFFVVFLNFNTTIIGLSVNKKSIKSI